MPKQSDKTNDRKSKNATMNTPTAIKADGRSGTKKKRGAPSQYANKVKPYLADIARYARCGVTEGQLCEFYGVGKTQWAQYKKENPELNETLCNAHRELKVDLCNRAFEVAMGYDYEEETTVTYKDDTGNITGSKTTHHKRHAKADANMIQFLLINRFSGEFARDPQAVELRKKALELAEQGKMPPDGVEGV